MEGIGGTQWVLEKEILCDQANLFLWLDLMSIPQEMMQKVPCTIDRLRHNSPFPLDPSHGADALHRSRPPKQEVRILLEEVPGLPGKGLLEKQRYQC